MYGDQLVKGSVYTWCVVGESENKAMHLEFVLPLSLESCNEGTGSAHGCLASKLAIFFRKNTMSHMVFHPKLAKDERICHASRDTLFNFVKIIWVCNVK